MSAGWIFEFLAVGRGTGAYVYHRQRQAGQVDSAASAPVA